MSEIKVTQAEIDLLLNSADVQVRTEFGKCTVVTARLQNGFILTESSACVDPANYDAELGKRLCLQHIENRLWEVDERQRAGKHRGAARGGRMMTRSEVLHAAEVCVCGQREEDYGTPEDSFRVIGELWETYLKAKCIGDPQTEVCIVPEDVAAMLGLLKIARIATGHGKSDNWVDLAGYAACGGELQSRPAR